MAPPRTPKPGPGEVTRLLEAWRQGDGEARDSLIPLVYAELRRRAAGHMRRERRGHTFRPTDLVHETYLRLCAQNPAWQNREQLFAVASRLMRRILVDHARMRAAAKRGGVKVTLAEGMASAPAAEPDLLDLDGLNIEEAARALEVSVATANRDWMTAKAWLFRRLKKPATR